MEKPLNFELMPIKKQPDRLMFFIFFFILNKTPDKKKCKLFFNAFNVSILNLVLVVQLLVLLDFFFKLKQIK